MMGTFKLKLKKEEGIFIRVILYIRSEICVLNLSSLHLFVCFLFFNIQDQRCYPALSDFAFVSISQ